MRLPMVVIGAVMVGVLGACSNAHEDAARAQEKVHEANEQAAKERLALVEKYQECVKDAKNDKQKVEACDTYLKAAEALN
jgi:ribulose kinase